MTRARDYDYVCPTCTRRRQGNRTTSNHTDDSIVLGPTETEVVEEVESFCYLGSIVDREDGVVRAVCARVATAWSKWRDISSLLGNRRISLKTELTST